MLQKRSAAQQQVQRLSNTFSWLLYCVRQHGWETLFGTP
jgi:hypothetical protein